MVSVNQIGGAGNCLFQIATVFAFAKRNGFDYAVPLENSNPHYVGQYPYEFPGINYSNNIPLLTPYREPAFNYSDIPVNDNTNLLGYFQSWRYFDDFREELLGSLGFKWKMLEGVVSIHIRRTDYLKYPTMHPVVSYDYISQAMQMFPEKDFAIFTDDPNWDEPTRARNDAKRVV